MLVLAIDTAAEFCSACVWNAGLVPGRCVEPMRTGHAERLMAVIDAALSQADVGFADIDRIAVSVGPGSFTGIRVGVATARGLSLALKVPAVGISTLEAIAFETRTRHPARAAVVLLGTGTGPLSVAVYGPEGDVLQTPVMLESSAAQALAARFPMPVLVGSGAERLAALLPAGSFDLGAREATAAIEVFAQLAAERSPGEKPVPLYLRAPDAKPQDKAGLPRRA